MMMMMSTPRPSRCSKPAKKSFKSSNTKVGWWSYVGPRLNTFGRRAHHPCRALVCGSAPRRARIPALEGNSFDVERKELRGGRDAGSALCGCARPDISVLYHSLRRERGGREAETRGRTGAERGRTDWCSPVSSV